jgi:hypothetical protein
MESRIFILSLLELEWKNINTNNYANRSYFQFLSTIFFAMLYYPHKGMQVAGAHLGLKNVWL